MRFDATDDAKCLKIHDDTAASTAHCGKIKPANSKVKIGHSDALTSWPHIFEAGPQNEDFPNTVLLFELGCAHPALRVTGNIEIAKK